MQFKILAAVFAAMLGVAITSPVPAPAPTEVDCWPFAQNQCN
jgi:hypothetical protein